MHRLTRFLETADDNLTAIIRKVEVEAPGPVHNSLVSGRPLEAETIGRTAGHLTDAVEGIVADPGRNISEQPMLGERRRLVVEWNAIDAEYPAVSNELFDAQAERTPGATALVFDNQELTWGELNWWSNQLAHYLRGWGVGPDNLVAIRVERSVERVVGLLGILKAGAAYLPLDPSYPPKRFEQMLGDAAPIVVLTQQGRCPARRRRSRRSWRWMRGGVRSASAITRTWRRMSWA